MTESKSQLKRRAIQRPDSVNCPKCLQGVMFDVGSRLSDHLGVKHTRCDKCGHSLTHVVNPESL